MTTATGCTVSNIALERRRLLSRILMLVAPPFVGLATSFAVCLILELFGAERRYASNFGVSISKCQEMFQIVGTSEDGQCSRYVPREHRTEIQLAVEIMILKIERRDMRGKQSLPRWYAPEQRVPW